MKFIIRFYGLPIHETIDETLDNATIVCHTDDETNSSCGKV